MNIHPTAIIDPNAEIAEDVSIGPFCVIDAHVKIGAGTVIDRHVSLYSHTVIGENCHLFPGAVIGTPPQDLSYKGEPTQTIVGDRVHIHEYATIHRASRMEKVTQVGDDCLLMAYSHVGHDCQVGNSVILANNVHLGGHVQVGDYANLGGSVVVHQFCRIGRFAMMSGFMATRQDIPPFSITDERLATIRGLNKIGLKRRGISTESILNLKKAFRFLWFKGLSQSEALRQVKGELSDDPFVQELVSFIESSKRGIRRPHWIETAENLAEV